MRCFEDKDFDKKSLGEVVLGALRSFYADASNVQMIKNGVNERCIAAWIFHYLNNVVSICPTCGTANLPELRWDLEYNRNGESSKEVDGGKVIPDLILHKRGSDKDICVIEIKKEKGAETENDYRKLMAMTSQFCKYRYAFGIHLILGENNFSMAWFKNGCGKPFSFERYNAKTGKVVSFLGDEENNPRRRSCTLMVTRSCNLNCSYCYEPFKCNDKSKDMTFAVAKKILEKEFEFVAKSKDFDEIEIDFMGGEPFMNFSLIKQVVEWLERNPPPMPYICFATTNGTLVKKHKAWLMKHRVTFQLGFSYDGSDAMQNANRGRKSSAVDLNLAKELYPRQGLHMVISKATVRGMADGILDMQRKGFRIDAALAQGEEWDEDDADEYGKQLEMLAKAYLEDHSLAPVNLLTRAMATIGDDPRTVEQRKFCGTGTHMATYDYEGKKYGCHLFTPIVLGDQAVEACRLDFECEAAAKDEFCGECRLKGICPTCAGFNYRYRGKLSARDHRWCPMVLAQTRVACAFQIKRFLQDKNHTEAELNYAKWAMKAQEILEAISDKAMPPYATNKKRSER